MPRMVTLKQASEATGLSQWELRTGVMAGRYPHLRIGNSLTGKILFDIEILQDHIKKLLLSSIKVQVTEHGTIRKIEDKKR